MRKYLSEFVGTMMLVFFGCGSAVVVGMAQGDGAVINPIVNVLAISAVFGLILMAMAYSIGNVSSCHINPAVSLAMLISGKMTVGDFFGYIIAQFAGGFAGSGLLALIVGTENGLGANGFGSSSMLNTTMWQAIGIEVILTFVFVLLIIGVTSKFENKSISGLVIGLALTLVHIIGIPFTGTSVNPARSLAPAVICGGEALSQVWVFLVAPLVGAALAALFYMLISPKRNITVKKAK